MDNITLISPLDMHLHLRDNEMLKTVAPLSSYSFSGAIVMPNLIPPLTCKDEIEAYKKRVCQASDEVDTDFEPYMTIFWDKKFDLATLMNVKDSITAVKFYPSGSTTNSEAGLSFIDIDKMGDILQKMSDLGIPLLFHGESNGFVLDREREFLPTYEALAKSFPKLKIMMEHISCKESVELLDKYSNLYATVTVHHLMFTLDELIGGGLSPHYFCKPVVKTPSDRDALRELVFSGNDKVMFGSDSAPHPVQNKLNKGAAGVFTAPIALPVLCELFEQNNKLDLLQKFVSDNAQNIYGVTPPYKEVKLSKKEWTVPAQYGDVVPMYANEKLNWEVVSVN
jgi:dihydroorotase